MPAELSRSLKPRHITMISIGGIIGAGLFVGSSAAIVGAGPAIVLSYVITGVLVLLVMRMLGEMALALPQVHSFTEFARAGLGPWAGFVAGWLYWYFWIIVVPVEAIAGANILHAWLGLPTWLLGLLLMAVMTAVNLMSARSYGEFEFWFASIKVAAILVFIALAAAFACGITSGTGPTFGNLTAYGGFAPHGVKAVLAGAVTVYFSLTGAEITTIAAAESSEPARAVAQMSTSVILRILTFYVGSIFLIVSVVPWVQVRSGESPFTLALSVMHFKWASLAMSAIILTAVLSCLNSAFYVCSRVLFVLAVAGAAQRTPRADPLGVDRKPRGRDWHSRRGHLVADGVRFPRQRLRRAHRIRIHDDRRRPYPPAPRARGERRASAGSYHVVLPVGELCSRGRHGGASRRHGVQPRRAHHRAALERDLPRGGRGRLSAGALAPQVPGADRWPARERRG
jgi:L-asparagine transporter-like permease